MQCDIVTQRFACTVCTSLGNVTPSPHRLIRSGTRGGAGRILALDERPGVIFRSLKGPIFVDWIHTFFSSRYVSVISYTISLISLFIPLFRFFVYVVLISTFSCILCFYILFYIVGSCKCRIFGLVVQLLFWANKWWWWCVFCINYLLCMLTTFILGLSYCTACDLSRFKKRKSVSQATRPKTGEHSVLYIDSLNIKRR